MARLLRRGRANWLGCVTILRDKRRGGGGVEGGRKGGDGDKWKEKEKREGWRKARRGKEKKEGEKGEEYISIVECIFKKSRVMSSKLLIRSAST